MSDFGNPRLALLFFTFVVYIVVRNIWRQR